ncbi:MAG TPA: ATP-binding protein [Sumerlaeia bacterium]|nr:ATP-binding protein [Sumerlaeia bacterium]
MRRTRVLTVYTLLAVAWVILCGWQAVEHGRFRDSARAALLNRALDISRSLGVVIRSQGRFGIIRQPRLEAALEDLAESKELLFVALLNAQGGVVASAGEPVDLDLENLPEKGGRWDRKALTVVNLVDLGLGIEDGTTTGAAPLVLPPRDSAATSPTLPSGEARTSETLRDAFFRRSRRTVERTSQTVVVRFEMPADLLTTGTRSLLDQPPGDGHPRPGPPPAPPFEHPPGGREEGRREPPPGAPPPLFRRPPGRRGEGHEEPSRPPFRRPFWMTEERYKELLPKQGLHGFVLQMSVQAPRAEIARDRWLRLGVGGIALMAFASFGVAWRGFQRSSELQLRLIRASEMNSYLREMNVAAAGLAHETRNPLNIVRGLTQMISNDSSMSAETRKRSHEIIEEVDRVTSRLNEFIDYSKPREAKLGPTNLSAVVRDVGRTLESDREEKGIRFSLMGPELVVEADESLLRQVLFNLLLNAIQAVDPGGAVDALIEQPRPGEACLEVRDNGPGVPEEIRGNLFRPYVTTQEGGAGLGLAVVRQIVLVHHWEIGYLPREDGGSRFRITGLKVIQRIS